MKQFFFGLVLAALASCEDMKRIDPETRPERLAELREDSAWLGNMQCQFGGIAGIDTCPDCPFDPKDKVLFWHN